MSYWIIRTTREVIGDPSALKHLPEFFCRIPRDADRARAGDQVAFWEAEADPGVLALGTIVAEPALETGVESPLVARCVPVPFVAEDQLSGHDNAFSRMIGMGYDCSALELNDEQWAAFESMLREAAPRTDPSAAAPAGPPLATPLPWNDRRRHAMPMPGGAGAQLRSLRSALAGLEAGATPRDDVVNHIRFVFDASNRRAKAILRFIEGLELIESDGELLRLSEAGRRVQEHGDGRVLVGQLHAHVQYIGELLGCLDVPRTHEQLVAHANEHFEMAWRTTSQLRERQGWLLSVGAVELIGPDTLRLTDLGHALADELDRRRSKALVPLVGPEPHAIELLPRSGLPARRRREHRIAGFLRRNARPVVAGALIAVTATLLILSRLSSTPEPILEEAFTGPALDPAWVVLSGEFLVDGGAIQPFDTDSLGLLAATLPTLDHADIDVTLPVSGEASGLAFDIVDADNFYAVVAAPAFGTWNVIEVIDGEPIFLFNTQSSYRTSDTSVRLESRGNFVGIFIDERPRATIERRRPDLPLTFGLLALASNDGSTLWSSVTVTPV